MLNKIYIYLFHALFIAPLLLFIGIKKCQMSYDIQNAIFNVCLVLGVGAIAYHGFNAVYYLINGYYYQ